jgi:molybdopterin synthase catalytic subunit
VIVLSGHCGVHKKGTLKLEDVLNSVKQHPNYSKVGAVAFFIGTVRGESLRGETVKALELEAFDEKADETLEAICNDLKARKGIVDVQIHHFTGKFDLGEDIVYVIVAGGHRKDVFPVLEEAAERYKKEAPIFKKEHVKGIDGKMKSYWVSEREKPHSNTKKR